MYPRTTGTPSGGTAPSAVLPNASWLVANWYVDPVGGSDNNAGTLASPVKTVMGGIVARWGTSSPTLVQTTTIYLLNGETADQENVVLSPIMVQGTNFAIVGTLGANQLIATFNIGTVTAKNRSSNTPLSVAGFTTGRSGIQVGQIVVNNVTGSRAVVSAISGTTATLSQPLATQTFPASATLYPQPAEDDTWATGQSVSVYAPPLLNLKYFQPRGGDNNDTETAGVAWVQAISIPDVSGTDGDSTFSPQSQDIAIQFYDCEIGPYVATGPGSNSLSSAYLIGCALLGGMLLVDATVLGGMSANFGPTMAGLACIDLDHQIIATNSGFVIEGQNYVGYVYVGSGQNLPVNAGAIVITGDLNGTSGAAIYGGGGGSIINVFNGARLYNNNNTWVSTLIISATLQLDDNTAGTRYVSGTWTDGVTITAANLDEFGSLQNPLKQSIYAGTVSA